MKTVKSVIHKFFRLFGLDIVRYHRRGEALPPDFEGEDAEIVQKVQSWTMTSPERVFALIQAVR
jgi:O-methyltransferase